MAIRNNKTPPIDPVTIAQQHRQQEEIEVQSAFQKGITALKRLYCT